MGANLGTPRQSTPQRSPKDGVSDELSVHHRASSIIEMLKPACLRAERGEKQPSDSQERKAMEMCSTLEDCLLSSPSREDDKCLHEGELHVPKQSSRVHPHHLLEDVVKFNEGVKGRFEVSSSLSRSQSEKVKKKVSFRMPEEADIIVFYALDEEHGDGR